MMQLIKVIISLVPKHIRYAIVFPLHVVNLNISYILDIKSRYENNHFFFQKDPMYGRV